MNEFETLQRILYAGILLAFFIFIMLQLTSFLLGAGKKDLLFSAVRLALMIGELILLTFLVEKQRSAGGEELYRMLLLISGLCIAVGFCSVWDIRRQILRRKSEITRFSIKEGFDNLPMALCVFQKNGLPVLCNRKMQELAQEATGKDVQNAEELWTDLTGGRLVPGAERISGEGPVLRLGDGGVWTFSRTEFASGENSFYRISASDTTGLYALSEKLKEENVQLKKISARLRRFLASFAAMKTEEEVLQAKIRVHDDIGHSVLATRRFLLSGKSFRESKPLLNQWRLVTGVLRSESEGEETTLLSQFEDAARAVGVTLRLDGTIPEEKEAAYLVICAMRECLTNAVRYAAADVLTVRIALKGDWYAAEITNNGKPPERAIVEGGGLSGVRSRIENAGGEMKVQSLPEFRLTVRLPREAAGILERSGGENEWKNDRSES